MPHICQHLNIAKHIKPKIVAIAMIAYYVPLFLYAAYYGFIALYVFTYAKKSGRHTMFFQHIQYLRCKIRVGPSSKVNATTFSFVFALHNTGKKKSDEIVAQPQNTTNT